MEIIINKLIEIESIVKRQYLLSKEFFTIEEAAEYLQVSLSAIYKLTSNNEIAYFKPGGKKIYFKKENLKEWIERSKVLSVFEIDSEVEDYLSKRI